jgi:hypothetical protein
MDTNLIQWPKRTAAHPGSDLENETVASVGCTAKIESFTDEMHRILPVARRAVSMDLGDEWRFEFSSEPTGFAAMTEPGRRRIRMFEGWAREQSYDDLAFVVNESIRDALDQTAGVVHR